MARLVPGGPFLPSNPGGFPSMYAPWPGGRVDLHQNIPSPSQSPYATSPEAPFILLPRKGTRRSPSRARRCGAACPVCALQTPPRGHLQRWRYRSIVPEILPPSIKSDPSHATTRKPTRDIPHLEPSSIYTLIYRELRGIYSFALYFTRSVPWKPGFLCRGTLNHPTQYGVSYHQRKANLSTKTGNLLAAVRIGSLDGVNGRKLLRHMGSIRVEGPELQTTQPEHKFVAWWRKAICLLWTKGYLDCEHTLDFGRVERELVEIASEREVALFSGSQEQEAVAVCDSQLFL